MPYIQQTVREWLARGSLVSNPGELNFSISRMVDCYITQRGLSYATLNEVIGALECAKLELYRRVAAPYEDRKCAENGEVFRNADS